VGRHIRDDRQMKAFTGLSQAPFDALRPVFRDLSQATQQKTYDAGVASGTRRRKPGGGAKGNRPTLAETLLFVLYDSQTAPTFDGLGTQCEMGRSKANETLQKLSPILYELLGEFALMPDRELGPPAALTAAWHGGEQGRIAATERAYRRSQEDAKQREHSSGKKTRVAK
jgi:hypothetical protein